MPSDHEPAMVQVGEATIPSGPEAPFLARTIVSGWLGGRADAELHEHARLLVSELVTNSVVHADQRAGAPVHIRAAAVNGLVRLEIEDHGHGSVRRRAPDPAEGGYSPNHTYPGNAKTPPLSGAFLEPTPGLEPGTPSLRVKCSAS